MLNERTAALQSKEKMLSKLINEKDEFSIR